MLLLWSRPYTVLQISTLFSASEVSSPNTPRGGYLKHTCKASVALGIKTRHPNSACEAPYGVVLPTLLPLHSSSQLPECLLTLPQGFCTGWSLHSESSIPPLPTVHPCSFWGHPSSHHFLKPVLSHQLGQTPRCCTVSVSFAALLTVEFHLIPCDAQVSICLPH